MHFAFPLPLWAAVLIGFGILAIAALEYRRPLIPLSTSRRVLLGSLRALTLGALVLLFCRPIIMRPPTSRDAIVPILVDSSRSMRLADADGATRIARASTLLSRDLLPGIGGRFKAEVFGVGDGLTPASSGKLTADARQTDLVGALRAVRDRYRGQRIAGLVLISDGGDTSANGLSAPGVDLASLPPVYAIGVGSADGLRDREVLSITAGDPRLDQSTVDLHVTAISSGLGRGPFQLRVLENGRAVDSRRLTPPADGSPIDAVFTVSPNLTAPTVYTAEIAPADGEAAVENNARSTLVSPAGRKRRLLMIEGAPGFEHAFIRRELVRDPAFEIDAVVRKGKNEQAKDTFLVQAAAARTTPLLGGFPARREDLYAYDAVVLADVEGEFFSRAQLALLGDFVAERGGGLLVAGGRSFAQRSLIGTPIEAALPIELDERRSGVARASLVSVDAVGQNRIALTPQGEDHPVMRVGATREETRRAWGSMPALATVSPLGGPRPGATVLAVTQGANGVTLPLVAVQPYGQGRSMVFAGEGSWRWKMLMPSTDRTHEFFWRLAARWLAMSTPDPVAITVPPAPEPQDTVAVDVDVRDNAFAPVADAAVTATLTAPGGDTLALPVRQSGATPGRYSGSFRPEQAGLYRVGVEARRGASIVGASDRWVYVGGADREFADPRLNESFLRRLARGTGGRYVNVADASHVVSWMQSARPTQSAPERLDLWHEPWAFALVVGLLAAEWLLRRRWGLR